jgi:lysophospholipase L1-like esterase
MRFRFISTARIVLSAVICVVTLETLARLEDCVRHNAHFAGSYSIESIYTWEHGLKRGKPNASYLKWKLNEAGFRGPALRESKLRIVCLGSSETFGLYESENREWPRRLEAIVNRDAFDSPVEVVNTAFPGMSVASALRRLPETMGRLHPRIVVVYPSYTPYINVDELNENGVAPAPRFEWRMRSRLETLLKVSLPAALQDDLREMQLNIALRNTRVLDKVPDENVRRFTSDIHKLVATAREFGARPVLVTHATRFGSVVTSADRPFLIAWRKFYPFLSEEGFLDMERRMSDAIRNAGAEDDATVIDAARLMKPGGENFVEFVHFTDGGANALAEIVAAGLAPTVRSCLASDGIHGCGATGQTPPHGALN